MKNRLLKQAEREYNPKQRMVALLIEGVFFLAVLPVVLVKLSSWLEQLLRLPIRAFKPIRAIISWLFIVGGFLFALWSIIIQFTIGKGTPAPVMATQKLIVRRPYNYCRNPMALGTILFYLGIALLIGSLSALGLVLLGAIFLLTYIKLIEEKEMELRFGEDYQKYRQQTPFLIPCLWQKNK